MNSKEYGIFIPSIGRAGRQFTVARIPKSMLELTTVVVPQGEGRLYSKSSPVPIKVIECPLVGIGQTRQWLIDNCSQKYILMFDDDLYFYHRKNKHDWHLETNTMEDNEEMIDRLFKLMTRDRYDHIGMATRTEASFYLCKYRTCTRINNVHGFNVKAMRRYKTELDARFDKLVVMEDFHVTLTLLEAGIPNKTLLENVWNQPGSNTEGGCSTYRTPELQARAAHRLARLHPQFVTVVTKKVIGATSWAGMKERVDVRVDWHKAWLSNGNGDHKHWKIERKYKRRVGK